MNTFVRYIYIISSIFYCSILYAQDKIEGIVLDKDTKQRIARVLLINKTTGANTYNNMKGEFALEMNLGDQIIAQKEHYFNDTLIYNGAKVLIVNLKKTAILIDPVTVVARRSPEEILAQRRRDYSKTYRLADPGSFISVGPNGAGLSIDAVYNYFSKEGKNARRLIKYFEREYEDNVIDMRFSKELIRTVTGLEGEPLDNFLVRYRPSYDFVVAANHYQMVHYIKTKYEFFKHVPYIKPLPNLQEIKTDFKD